MEINSEGSSMQEILLCFLTFMIELTSNRFCEACGGQIRDFPGVLRSPDNDGDGLYENSLSCYWTIIADEDHVVEFSIYELDLQPDCMDFIFLRLTPIYDGRDRSICGNELIQPVRVTSDGRILEVIFGTNSEVTGRGFEARFRQTADPSCGHSTRYIAGLVHSPSLYSDWIDSHLDCEWEIESTGHNSGIQLLITKMHIHNVDFGCITDYLQVIDGDLKERYCGSDTPSVRTYSKQSVRVLFHSDSRNNNSSFKLIYADIDLQRECGGILNGTVGIIQSSPFDSKGRYENLISCSWVIVVPEEEAVFFEFETIDVEYDATCSKDYIQISEGFYYLDTVLGKYCGNTSPPPVISRTNIVYVWWKTNDYLAGKGFVLKYRSAISTKHTTVMTTESTTTEALGILFLSSTDVNSMNGGDKKHRVHLVLIFFTLLQMLFVS